MGRVSWGGRWRWAALLASGLALPALAAEEEIARFTTEAGDLVLFADTAEPGGRDWRLASPEGSCALRVATRYLCPAECAEAGRTPLFLVFRPTDCPHSEPKRVDFRLDAAGGAEAVMDLPSTAAEERYRAAVPPDRMRRLLGR